MHRLSRMGAVTGALLGVTLVSALMWFGSGALAATASTVTVGSAPAAPAGSHDLGALASGSTLSIAVALEPRNPASLAAYALGVSTPGSPDYHHYLSVAEFAQRFAPSPSTVAAVQASLRSHGLGPGALSANGLSLTVRANAGTFAQAFSTSFERYRLRDGSSAFANTRAPRLDAAVAGHVQAIIGLQTLARRHPEALLHTGQTHSIGAAPHLASAAALTPCTSASQVLGAYTADQIAGAYGASTLQTGGDLGSGQTVAVYELEGNFSADISAFASCYGITNPSVSYIPVDGGPATPDPSKNDGLETEIDVESILGLAPQASVQVYRGPNTNAGAYDTYNAIVSDNTASVISTSWGLCESQLMQSDPGAAAAENTLFQEAAAQGQSVVAASGDFGAEDCYPDPTPAVDDPGSQPFVTDVGGTTLTSLPPARNEVVWLNTDTAQNGGGSGGGGISSLWTMPGYQTGATSLISTGPSPGPCGSTACRQVPDISLDADPRTGYATYYLGWLAGGGTSAAAPTFGALLALINASSSCSGARVGFVNPGLYRTAVADWTGTQYTAGFNDITSGNNDWTGSNGASFAAAPGYDEASGLGSPIVSDLAQPICGSLLAVTSPANQTSITGRAATLQLQATDPAGLAVHYSATGLPPGLTVSGSTGMITGTPTTAGTYHVRAIAVDAQDATGSATFTWTVTGATVALTAPGDQAGQLERTASLQLQASDDNGATIRYGATGLPRGLSIDATTGRISGKLSRAGTASVTVSAAALGAPTASRSFKWRVSGPPGYSHASLGGVSRGKPALKLRLSAGIDSPSVRSITLALPKGLSFGARSARAHKRVTVTASNGKRLRYSVKIVRGRLVITLTAAASQVRLAVTTPALGVTRQLSGRTRSHSVGVLTLSVTVRDSAGLSTGLPVRVRPT
jgi:subtilase family serine protease